MRRLSLAKNTDKYHDDFIQQCLDFAETKSAFVEVAKQGLERMNIEL